MNDFVFHPDALKDLDEIWEYIASESIDAADRVRDEIYDAIKSVVPFPILVINRPEFAPAGPVALPR